MQGKENKQHIYIYIYIYISHFINPVICYWALGLLPCSQDRFFCFYFVFFGHISCGILAPRPGIEPVSLALEPQSLNHWTDREVPRHSFNGWTHRLVRTYGTQRTVLREHLKSSLALPKTIQAQYLERTWAKNMYFHKPALR